MKRKLAIVLAALMLCAIVSGCDNSAKTVNVELEENVTTGYSWTYTNDNEAVLKNVKDEAVAANSELSGAPGKHQWTFEAVGDGEAILTFVYAQSWAGGMLGETRVYEYSVQNGKPTLVSEETIEPPETLEQLVRLDAVYSSGDDVLVNVVYMQYDQCGTEGCVPEVVDGEKHTFKLKQDAYLDFSEDMGPVTVKVAVDKAVETFAGYPMGVVCYDALIIGDEIASMTFHYVE